MALLRGIRDGNFKRSLSKSSPKTITELSLPVENYINFKEALQAVDDLNLLNLGVAIRAKVELTSNSTRPKLSSKKSLADLGRDTHKRFQIWQLTSHCAQNSPSS